MSAPKTRNAWGMLAKVESTYGTNSSPVAGSDGVLLSEKPDPDFSEYLNDGDRGKTPAGAPRARAAQSGRWGSLAAPAELIGGGAAYSASVFTSLHPFLRGCGLELTGSFTGGAEKWTAIPEIGPTGLDSLTMQAYLEGQLYELLGAYGTFEVGADGPVVPRWDFKFNGIASVPTDVAIPSITYPVATRIPPKSENIGLTLGLLTGAKVRRWHFTQNRDIDTARADQNNATNAHAGFTPGQYNPVFEVTIEKTALATVGPWHTATTINPYMLKELGTLLVCKLAIGSTQYNRWKLGAGGTATEVQAQIIDVKDGEDGPTSTWEMTVEFKPSSYILNDAFAIVAD